MLRVSSLAGVWLAIVLPGAGMVGEDVVVVRDVRFEEARTRYGEGVWHETVIELEARGGNPGLGEDELEVGLQLAFRQRGGAYTYFRAAAKLRVPARGERAVVRFLLPPAVVEREGWAGREPEAWRVWLGLLGRTLSQAPGTYSEDLRDPVRAQAFARQMEVEAPANDGWLQPVYLTPFYSAEDVRMEDAPAYRRGGLGRSEGR